MVETMSNYHNNNFDRSQEALLSLLSSICVMFCLVITVLGIKIRWFKRRLNIESMQNESNHNNHHILYKSRSMSSQQVENDSMQGVFRIRNDEDSFIERPQSLPPVRVSNKLTSQSQLFLIRRNLRTTNILEPSPSPIHNLKVSESSTSPATNQQQQQQENFTENSFISKISSSTDNDDLESEQKIQENHNMAEEEIKIDNCEEIKLEKEQNLEANPIIVIPEIKITQYSSATLVEQQHDSSTPTITSSFKYDDNSDAESDFSFNLQEIQKQLSRTNSNHHYQENKLKSTLSSSSLSPSQSPVLAAKRLTGIFSSSTPPSQEQQDRNSPRGSEEEENSNSNYASRMQINLERNIEIEFEQEDDTKSESKTSATEIFIESKNSYEVPTTDSAAAADEFNIPSRKFQKFQTKPVPRNPSYFSKDKSYSETDLSVLNNDNGEAKNGQDNSTPSQVSQPQNTATSATFPRKSASSDKLNSLNRNYDNNNEDDHDDDSWSQVQRHRNLTQRFATIARQQQQKHNKQRHVNFSFENLNENSKDKNDDNSQFLNVKKPRNMRDMRKNQETSMIITTTDSGSNNNNKLGIRFDLGDDENDAEA